MASKESEPKRRLWQKALVMVVFMAVGGAVGYFGARMSAPMESTGRDPMGTVALIVLLVASLAVAYFAQIILHEAGHLAFGLATGYRFLSFRVGGLMVVKQDGRLRFKRFSLAGTGGQCLMCPPDLVNGRMPYKLYNLGGSLANALVAALGALCALVLPKGPATSFFVFLAVIGFAFALLNGIPLSIGGVDNDGKNLRSASEGPEAMHSLWVILKAGEELARGRRVKDMPADWFVPPADPAQLRNPLVASVAVLACGRLLDEGRVADAESAIRDLLRHETAMLGLHRSLLKVDLAYCELMGENRPQEVERILDADARKTMKAMKNFPSVLRTRYAQALLADGDEAAARRVRDEFDRMSARYPHPREIEGERELMDAAAARYRDRITQTEDRNEEEEGAAR